MACRGHAYGGTGDHLLMIEPLTMTTLVPMTVDQIVARDLHQAAVHEAGHFVVARQWVEDCWAMAMAMLAGGGLLVIALPLAGHAAPICDMQGKCWADAPHQTYHMDPSNPDRETPQPAPQYPQADVGRSITVQPNACHLFRMRSVPNIEPQIVEICPVPPDEERAIRERVEGLGAAQ